MTFGLDLSYEGVGKLGDVVVAPHSFSDEVWDIRGASSIGRKVLSRRFLLVPAKSTPLGVDYLLGCIVEMLVSFS